MKQRSTQKVDIKVKRKYKRVSYNGSRGKILLAEKPTNGKFTKVQTERLLAFFEMNSCPDNQQKQELASELDLEVLQVATWFSNRRSRLRRAALNKQLDQDAERANANASPALYGSHTITMMTAKTPCLPAQAFIELSAPSQSLVPPYRNAVISSVLHENHSNCFVPHTAFLPRVPGSSSTLLAIPTSQQQEFQHSYFNPTQCLQYCDQLLQKMFGQDWIDKVNTRQN